MITIPYLQEKGPCQIASPRILLVRLSAHGDTIQTWPLVGWIRRYWPEAQIGWLVGETSVPLIRHLPGVDTLHVLPDKIWKKRLTHSPWQLPTLFEEGRQIIHHLKESRYDVAVDVQGLWKSALWAKLAEIPVRLGFEPSREGVSWCYTHTLPATDYRQGADHTSVEWASLLTWLGLPPPNRPILLHHLQPPPLNPEALQWLQTTLASSDKKAHWPLVVLAPFTIWPSKHWPAADWIALMKQLTDWPVRVVLTGGPADTGQATSWFQQAGGEQRPHWFNLTGQTDWDQLMALLSQACVVVGADSAPLHLASALTRLPGKTRATRPALIGLYGPTAIERTGPLNPEATVLTHPMACQPCHRRICPLGHKACLSDLSVETVLQAIGQALPIGVA